jgi:5-methylcytosine-specific restriction protein B
LKIVKNIIGDNIYKNILAQDILYQCFEKNIIEQFDKYDKGETKMQKEKQSINQILYGPPGTGKTYNTINRALSIIENKSLEELEKEDRGELKKRFDEYKKAGQIEFVTFHQSYGYEEFVEGIKAENDENGNLRYEIKDGIFKKIAKKSQISDNFEEIYEKFLNIVDENGEKILKTKTGKKFKIKINSNNNLTLMTGEKFTIQGTITKDALYNNNYKYWKSYSEPILNELKKLGLKIIDNSNKNFVLIIDEINRGNISKIFGELITLIEPSKRIGVKEEIKVKLPYSNEEFGVPKNLYIIGTMNTADRSIALLDTALRRRFEFVEMMPKPEFLEDIEIDGIDIKNMLETINKRIEYLYDRDHTIGHSYFMSLKNNQTIEELQNIFKNKIVPLLQEYFYDDFEKIMMVLGEGFVDKKEINSDIFDYKIDDYLDDEKYIYEIKENFDFSDFKK